jgi:hypothetical protein
MNLRESCFEKYKVYINMSYLFLVLNHLALCGLNLPKIASACYRWEDMFGWHNLGVALNYAIGMRDIHACVIIMNP